MNVRQLAIALAFVVSAPALAQCSADGSTSSSDEAGVVRYGAVEPSSLDPRKSGPLDAVFLTPVYDSLIHRTPGGDIEPRLATEWEFSGDGKALDLTLREGVEFQDGEKFDAEAVKANILAAKEPGAARASELEAIESVEVVDEYTVRLHLSRPVSQLVGVFAGEAGMMISPKALDDPDLASQPVGAGPYEVTKFGQGTIEYTAWGGYWNRDAVKNSKLIFTINSDSNTQFRALLSGQLNFYAIPFAIVDSAEKEGLELEAAPTSTIWQLLLNATTPELAKPEVRKAISLAIDRPAATDGAFGGRCLPTVQPFAEGILGHVNELDELADKQDIGEARRLMAEAGHEDGFELDLVSGSSGQVQDLGTVVQAQLKEIGISVKLNVFDQAQSTLRQRNGQFDIAINVTPAGRPDPASYIATYYVEGGLYNHGFSLDGVASGLAAAEATSDEAERQEALAEIAKAVYEAGAPTVPICNSQLYFGHRDNVSGFEVPRLNDYDWSTVVVE